MSLARWTRHACLVLHACLPVEPQLHLQPVWWWDWWPLWSAGIDGGRLPCHAGAGKLMDLQEGPPVPRRTPHSLLPRNCHHMIVETQTEACTSRARATVHMSGLTFRACLDALRARAQELLAQEVHWRGVPANAAFPPQLKPPSRLARPQFGTDHRIGLCELLDLDMWVWGGALDVCAAAAIEASRGEGAAATHLVCSPISRSRPTLPCHHDVCVCVTPLCASVCVCECVCAAGPCPCSCATHTCCPLLCAVGS